MLKEGKKFLNYNNSNRTERNILNSNKSNTYEKGILNTKNFKVENIYHKVSDNKSENKIEDLSNHQKSHKENYLNLKLKIGENGIKECKSEKKSFNRKKSLKEKNSENNKKKIKINDDNPPKIENKVKYVLYNPLITEGKIKKEKSKLGKIENLDKLQNISIKDEKETKSTRNIIRSYLSPDILESNKNSNAKEILFQKKKVDAINIKNIITKHMNLKKEVFDPFNIEKGKRVKNIYDLNSVLKTRNIQKEEKISQNLEEPKYSIIRVETFSDSKDNYTNESDKFKSIDFLKQNLSKKKNSPKKYSLIQKRF